MYCFGGQVLEVQQELSNIPRLFLQQPVGNFWVAEVIESSEASDLDFLINKTKKVGIFKTVVLWMNSYLEK